MTTDIVYNAPVTIFVITEINTFTTLGLILILIWHIGLYPRMNEDAWEKHVKTRDAAHLVTQQSGLAADHLFKDVFSDM